MKIFCHSLDVRARRKNSTSSIDPLNTLPFPIVNIPIRNGLELARLPAQADDDGQPELDMLPVAAPLDIDVVKADAGLAAFAKPQADAFVGDAAVARCLVQGVGQHFGRGQHIVDETDLAQLGVAREMKAEQVIAETGAKSKLIFKPLPQDDPLQRQPDIALARKHLGWEPKIPLKDGLKRTIAYFEDLLRRMKVEAKS